MQTLYRVSKLEIIFLCVQYEIIQSESPLCAALLFGRCRPKIYARFPRRKAKQRNVTQRNAAYRSATVTG